MNIPVQLILSSLCIVDRLSTFYKHWRSVLGARLFFQFAPRHLLNHCTTASFFTAKLAPPRHIQGGKSCTIQNIIKSGKFVILLAFNNSKFYLGNPCRKKLSICLNSGPWHKLDLIRPSLCIGPEIKFWSG